ncbi:hypothetical protein ACQPZX_19745 [Actinoplanes sp. CA-142083]|uniref:hypothetical protein n=1 Tax=Actinoplanes sp. CA-142083 TaxID=3239903 RepID=UPI003D931172
MTRTVRLRDLTDSSYSSLPTRQLCAAMNLNVGLRDFVLELFLGERHRAWGPNYGVDSTAVIRHAWRARRWQRERDIVLGLIVLTLVVLLVTRWWARGYLLAAGATVAWIVAAVAIRRLMRRRKLTVRKALSWSWRRKTFGRRVIVACVLVLLVALTITAESFSRALRREDAVIVISFVCVVLVIGIVDVFVVVGRARRALSGPRAGDAAPRMPRDQAPPMPDRLEKRLAALHDGPEPAQSSEDSLARVVAYDFASRMGSFLENTFVGSGSSLEQFEINIDVSQGRPAANGTRKKPKRVDLVSLHQSIGGTVLTRDLPGSWSGYRMYVDGQELNQIPALLPRPAGSPNGWLSLDEMHTGLAHPTAGTRTYLCLQAPVFNWEEQIILTLFIRADLTGQHLILHTETLILPRMAFVFEPWFMSLPQDWWTHCTTAAGRGSTRIWRAAIRSFLGLLGDLYRFVRRLSSTLNTKYRVRHDHLISHGAVFSIREKLAEGVVIVYPNAVQDINRTIAFLMQALRNGLADYLKGRNIDTSSLVDDIQRVTVRQQNKIGELNANNVVFGHKGKAGDKPAQKGESGGQGTAQ